MLRQRLRDPVGDLLAGRALANLAVGRRLQKRPTGWWLLLLLIPILGFLVLIYFMVQRGTPGANRFG